MVFSAKDHRAAVNAIKVTKDNSQAVSACADGSCIVWDLNKKVRVCAFFERRALASLWSSAGAAL
jgi:WD40 repeat protein